MTREHTRQLEWALSRARQIAMCSGSEQVEPVHLLVGLLATNGGASHLLASLLPDSQLVYQKLGGIVDLSGAPFQPGTEPPEDGPPQEGQEPPRDLFGVLRVDQEKMRKLVEDELREERMRERPPSDSPRAQATISCAVKEAEALGHTYLGTEHLLLGLLLDDDPVAGRALREAGVRITDARVRARALHAPESGWEERTR